MVEDVEGLKLELPLHTLRHFEVFEQGSIREVVRGSAEAVSTDVSDCSERGTNERPGLCSVRCKRGDRSKDSPAARDGIESSYTLNEASPGAVEVGVRTAIAGGARASRVAVDVLILSALLVGWRKGEAALPGCSACDLPPADCVVDPAISRVGKHLVLAKGQLVDATEYEELVAICVARPFLYTGVDREVSCAIVQCSGPCIVREELKAMSEALFDCRLKRVVGLTCRGSGKVNVLRTADWIASSKSAKKWATLITT